MNIWKKYTPSEYKPSSNELIPIETFLNELADHFNPYEKHEPPVSILNVLDITESNLNLKEIIEKNAFSQVYANSKVNLVTPSHVFSDELYKHDPLTVITSNIR